MTGQRFEIQYGSDGRRVITSIWRTSRHLDQIGELLETAECKKPLAYEINNGRLSTMIGEIPFDLMVFKSGTFFSIWLRDLLSSDLQTMRLRKRTPKQ